MKKLLFLFVALLTTMGAWADIDADGAVVTFTNVQQDGQEYALYISDANKLEVSSQPAADLGDAAKFRAKRVEGGKWTFYNEAKNLYMIWRGNGDGYNGNAGVLGEYNATYCDWTLYSGDGSKMGTHYMVSKRSNGTSDGSVVIMKAGSFDKYGNSVGWDSRFSNLYRIDIVELAPGTLDFVYNIGDGAYASNGWCQKWASNNASKPSLAVLVDVNNVNGGQAEAIGVRPGKAGSAAFNVNAGCSMLSLSFEAKGTANHKIVINDVEQTVGTEWKKFVINGVNASTTQFTLKGDNGNDCLLRNIRIVTSTLYVKAEVEGSWANNPNTHFGRVVATVGNSESVVNLTTAHLEEATHMFYSGGNDVVGFTRAYRGFEFQGFKIGEQELGKNFELTEVLKNSISAETPLVAKFAATNDVTLFYDDDEYSYRIPAIAKTSTGRLIAVSDYRHNLDDIGRDVHGTGKLRLDLVMRYSDDNGKTWSAKQTIAEGSGNKNANGYDCAYGDAAIATVGQKVLVMVAAGNVCYPYASATSHNRTVRVFSEDNGATWSKEDISERMFIGESALIPNGHAAFFGSGKLAVDENFNGTGNTRIYGAMLVKLGNVTTNIFPIYTDDLGQNWKILGGSTDPVANADEPKMEILPSGQILLSARRQGGRVFRVFTYGTGENDKANGAGSWGEAAANGCGNGGSNGTNGEIFLVDAKKADGTAVKLLLQSQPKGGSGHYDRNDVTIWYKEIDASTAYTTSTIKDGWTEGLQVSNQQSSYSAMSLQNDGKIAFFFEEAPCYGDDYTKGYCMVYVPLTIEGITKGNYFAPATDLNTTRTLNVKLTDAEGNVYNDVIESSFAGIGDALTTKYPFITLGGNADFLSDGTGYTYVNTVTLPFKVSNGENTVWHNIYFPSNGNGANEKYPVYMSSDDSSTLKIATEKLYYGFSDLNTLANADKISWAIYQEGNTFSFKFKNKQKDQYIKTTSDSPVNGRSQNVAYTTNIDEATAFGIVDGRSNSYVGEFGISANGGQLIVYGVGDGYVSYSTVTTHQGGWVKFVEAPDYEALIADINSMLSAFGTSLGQYSVAEANKATYEAAKTAMQNSSTVKLNDLNTYKALGSDVTLNMPKAGQFFRIKGISGNYIDAASIYNNASATTGQMSMKSAELCNYAGTIFYLDENNNLLNYATGRYVKETREIGAVGDSRGVWTFAESPRTGNAKYALTCTTTGGNGAHLHDNEGNRADRCSSNCGARHDFSLEEVVEIPVVVTGAKYATFFAPVSVALPEGVKAYYIAEAGNGYVDMTEIEDVIPANTGVILAGEANTYNLAITENAATVSGNKLDGTVASTYVQNDGYVLANGSNGVGLYKATKNQQSGSAFLNNGFKAYLPASVFTAGARFFAFDFGTETGIEETENGNVKTENSEIYDLSGRRVQNAQKGIFIVNGKKVIK